MDQHQIIDCKSKYLRILLKLGTIVVFSCQQNVSIMRVHTHTKNSQNLNSPTLEHKSITKNSMKKFNLDNHK